MAHDLYPLYMYDRFMWDPTERRFSADASALGWAPGDFESMFYIVGKTKKMLFYLSTSDEHTFAYKVSKAYRGLNPELSDITVVIFNT